MSQREVRGMIRPPALDLVAHARVSWDGACWVLLNGGGALVDVWTAGGTSFYLVLDDWLADSIEDLQVVATRGGVGYASYADRTPRTVAPPTILFYIDAEALGAEITALIYLPRKV